MAASIAYQTAASSGGGGPYSVALTVASAAGQERLITLSGIANGSGATVTFTGVAIDGQTATQVGPYAREGSGNAAVMSFWRAPGTANTSINVTATATDNMFDLRCTLWTLSNAGTLLDFAAVGLATTVLTQSLDVDTSAGGVVVAATMAFDNPVSLTWSGLTERFEGMAFYGNDFVGAADIDTASASTPLAITMTFGASGLYHIAALAVSFNPAATGITLTADNGSYTLTGSAMTGHLVMPLGAAGE